MDPQPGTTLLKRPMSEDDYRQSVKKTRSAPHSFLCAVGAAFICVCGRRRIHLCVRSAPHSFVCAVGAAFICVCGRRRIHLCVRSAPHSFVCAVGAAFICDAKHHSSRQR